MHPTADHLLDSCELLKSSVSEDIAGHERDWAARVATALDKVAEWLRDHVSDTEAPTGLLATEVDLTRPSLVRQVGRLRREHAELPDQARALRETVEAAAKAFDRRVTGHVPATDLPEPAPGPGIADLGAVRQSVEGFLAALLEHRKQEAGLAIESVTTDLGAGD